MDSTGKAKNCFIDLQWIFKPLTVSTFLLLQIDRMLYRQNSLGKEFVTVFIIGF